MQESTVKIPFFLMAATVLFCAPVAAGPAAQSPAAEPAAKSDAKSDAKSAAEPSAKSAAEPAAKSATEPAAKSAAEPTAKSAAEPAAKSAAEPAAKSAPEPAAKSAARSAAKSTETAAESAAEPDLDIDFETLTCREFLAKDATTKTLILLWVDGYISRDREAANTNNKWLEKLAKHLGQYCAKNGKNTIMDAIKDAPDED
jgi:type IV secretory pathway VirB10-like protein